MHIYSNRRFDGFFLLRFFILCSFTILAQKQAVFVPVALWLAPRGRQFWHGLYSLLQPCGTVCTLLSYPCITTLKGISCPARHLPCARWCLW